MIKDNVINCNKVVEIKSRLKELDEEEARLQYIDCQSEEDKARLRAIWKEQRELEQKLKKLNEK